MASSLPQPGSHSGHARLLFLGHNPIQCPCHYRRGWEMQCSWAPRKGKLNRALVGHSLVSMCG